MNSIATFLKNWWPFLLSLLAGMVFVTSRVTGFDFSEYPGDLGDGRFNLYILEHDFRYFTLQVKKLWSAPFMVCRTRQKTRNRSKKSVWRPNRKLDFDHLSLVFAFTIAYLSLNRWLQSFAYRIDQEPITYFLAALFALVVAFLTMLYLALRTANQNPASVLKYE